MANLNVLPLEVTACFTLGFMPYTHTHTHTSKTQKWLMDYVKV